MPTRLRHVLFPAKQRQRGIESALRNASLGRVPRTKTLNTGVAKKPAERVALGRGEQQRWQRVACHVALGTEVDELETCGLARLARLVN